MTSGTEHAVAHSTLHQLESGSPPWPWITIDAEVGIAMARFARLRRLPGRDGSKVALKAEHPLESTGPRTSRADGPIASIHPPDGNAYETPPADNGYARDVVGSTITLRDGDSDDRRCRDGGKIRDALDSPEDPYVHSADDHHAATLIRTRDP